MILYNKDRDPEELEPYYTRHVMAMTEEGLHSKSDIAAELAYRDIMIVEIIEGFLKGLKFSSEHTEQFEAILDIYQLPVRKEKGQNDVD